MINEVIEAVSSAIFDEFGEKITIYHEAVSQDMKNPCFFISCINPKAERGLFDKYHFTLPIIIQYFPRDSRNFKAECENASERLFITLDPLPINDGFVNGHDMSAEIVDGVLAFFVTYRVTGEKERNQSKMESIEIYDNVK